MSIVRLRQSKDKANTQGERARNLPVRNFILNGVIEMREALDN
jgi:hypothetical protein